MFVDHEKHALCDSYIVEFIHEGTENYYERGKYGCRSFHGTETPLYVLKVLKLLLIMKSMLYVIVILLSLFMRVLKIIMREENMVVEVFMVLKHLSMC